MAQPKPPTRPSTPAALQEASPPAKPTGRDQYAALLAAQSSRTDRYQHDVGQDRRAIIRAIVLAIVGVGIVATWKALQTGPQEATWYLLRFAVNYTLAALLFGAGTFLFIDYGGVLVRALVGLAGAMAMWDLSQHLMHYTYMPVAAWVVGMAAFMAFAVDLLDIEFSEAAVLAFLVLLGRLLLKWAVYDVVMV